MIYIKNDSTDPYFNQAFEEYIFEHSNLEDDILLLWVNSPALICGRYQNIFQEINVPLAEEMNIPIVRRNTGGGTVYHDPGNLNYSIIRKKEENFDYDSFLTPVIEALNKIGVPAHKRNICDIAINDMKISGSAQAVKKDRVLHHGTLLFNANLNNLRGLLKPCEGQMICKAVKSIPSPVTNISEYFTGEEYRTVNDFAEAFKEAFTGQNVSETVIAPDILKEIITLKEEKYENRQWNYGKGPKFEFQPQNSEISISVEAGIIVKCTDEKYIGQPAEKFFKEVCK